MKKEQRWVLSKIEQGNASFFSLRKGLYEIFKLGIEKKRSYNYLGTGERDELLDILKFLENDGFLIEGTSSMRAIGMGDVFVSPNRITTKGQKHGKWNWEKIANWFLTVVGLGLAAGTFYFQFFVDNTAKI